MKIDEDMLFDVKARQKWERGQVEHKSAWPIPIKEARKEAMEESIDLYHYAECLMNSEDPIVYELGASMRKVSRSYWKQLLNTMSQKERCELERDEETQTMLQKLKGFVKGE